eukprot:9490489-Pyramimonas_sp.AAC.1
MAAVSLASSSDPSNHARFTENISPSESRKTNKRIFLPPGASHLALTVMPKTKSLKRGSLCPCPCLSCRCSCPCSCPPFPPTLDMPGRSPAGGGQVDIILSFPLLPSSSSKSSSPSS